MSRPGILLMKRGMVKLAKSPGNVLTGMGTSLFFLLMYNAGIGGIGNLEAFGGAGYWAFIFPLGVVSLAMGSAAGAGQSLNADFSSGYFRRLFLSPAPRWAFAVAPVLADAVGTLVDEHLNNTPFGRKQRHPPARCHLPVPLLHSLWHGVADRLQRHCLDHR